MKQLENVEEKKKIAEELESLVKRANEIIESAPPFLDIRFSQLPKMTLSKNSHLQVWVTETVVY